jgi:benzoate-CoA ligase family protein
MHDHFNAATWLVDRHVDAGDGDRLAVVQGDDEYTYADVQHLSERVAAGLAALGVRPEERVAMVMLDSIEFVATFLGALRMGAVPVPMNPLLPGRDLGVIVADARARLIVMSAARLDSLGELLAGAPEVHTAVTTTTGDGSASGPGGTDDVAVVGWSEFMATAEFATTFTTWAESPGFWLCTSGSTGAPKLAMHRHSDIPATCATYADQVLGIGRDDVCYSVGPMFHAYGLGNSLTFPFSVGATAVLEPTRPPTPDLVADTVRRNDVTLFFCIPTFYAALLASSLPDDAFASVRWGVSAAEALPAETFERFRERFGVTILDGIGSTEQLHIYLSNRPDSTRPGTSGKAVPGYQARVIDENGNDQPADEPGQLLVRGPAMATGYWCRSDTSQSTFDGEWMRTGDLYSCNADGFYTYLGRVDDMLRVGGEWVSPAEVEGVLIEHETVLEAAIVGQLDDQGILRPVAFVVSAPGGEAAGAGALTEHCRERLAGYKRPKRYEFVDGLPKTATGKIQRFKLR